MHFLQAINSDLSVLTDCNETGGTIKGDIEKNLNDIYGQGQAQSLFFYRKPLLKVFLQFDQELHSFTNSCIGQTAAQCLQ
jgi:hypothetical protein